MAGSRPPEPKNLVIRYIYALQHRRIDDILALEDETKQTLLTEEERSKLLELRRIIENKKRITPDEIKYIDKIHHRLYIDYKHPIRVTFNGWHPLRESFVVG